MSDRSPRDRFVGSLLGVALGDALGAPREGRREVLALSAAELAAGSHPLGYTDDAHMTIGLADSLVACRGLDQGHLATEFAANYAEEPWRGYGPGPPRVFAQIRSGIPWREAAEQVYPGGSFGNGGAMRAAPVGLLYHHDAEALRRVAEAQAEVTHSHPLGREGAAIMAYAVALALRSDPSSRLDGAAFLALVRDFARQEAYRERLGAAIDLVSRPDDREAVIARLGRRVAALESVPTALYCFASHASAPLDAMAYAAGLGGDADTIAAMAGGIAGARSGSAAFPPSLVARLEGADRLRGLAVDLWRLWAELSGQS